MTVARGVAADPQWTLTSLDPMTKDGIVDLWLMHARASFNLSRLNTDIVQSG